MVTTETGLSVVQARSITCVSSEADALVREGAQLGEDLLALGYQASYLPGSGFQGLFGDFLILPHGDEIDRTSPMDDKHDVTQFVGGIIASSEYQGLPRDEVVRQHALGYICLGVVRTMSGVEDATEGRML